MYIDKLVIYVRVYCRIVVAELYICHCTILLLASRQRNLFYNVILVYIDTICHEIINIAYISV